MGKDAKPGDKLTETWPKTQRTEDLTQLAHCFGPVFPLPTLSFSSMERMALMYPSDSPTLVFGTTSTVSSQNSIVWIHFLGSLLKNFASLRTRPSCTWLTCYRIIFHFFKSAFVAEISTMSHVFLRTYMVIFYPATFHVDRATGIKMECDRYGSNFLMTKETGPH